MAAMPTSPSVRRDSASILLAEAVNLDAVADAVADLRTGADAAAFLRDHAALLRQAAAAAPVVVVTVDATDRVAVALPDGAEPVDEAAVRVIAEARARALRVVR